MQPLDPETLSLRGTIVVEASAGTGKTYTITSLFLRLLLESELAIDQILVVTYTRAATAELRDRIRKRLASALAIARQQPVEDAFVRALCARTAARVGASVLVERLERALASVDEAPVLTIHGFCQRVLRDAAFESGASFDTQLTAHAAPVLDEIADDYFARELFATSESRARLLLDSSPGLRRIAARVGGRGVRVVPERAREPALDDARFRAACAALRALFARERAALPELFTKLKGFAETRAAQAADTLAELLEKESAEKLCEWATLAKLTRSGATAKAGALPSHAFFELAEELRASAEELVNARQGVELAFRRSFVDYLEHELDKRTQERNLRTFDALLTDLDKALHGRHGAALRERLRAQYRAALVDEFQDTDPTQYRIFRTLFSGSGAPLLLIGDPKQAIYGFRGADVEAYLDARREAGEQVYTLDVNHRSDPSLVSALNALYARVELPFVRAQIAYRQVGVPASARERLRADDGRAPVDLAFVELGELGSDALRRELARKVASDIAALLAREPQRYQKERYARLRASDIAVLCRTNAEAALVQLALGERGVPSVLSGDASVFDSDDAAELERVLSALAHPGDARALRSFLASLYGGHDAEALLALESDDEGWETQRERMQRLHETWLAHGFMQALRALVHEYDVERRLLERSDGTRRITNLWHLAELLTEAALAERLGPLGLVRWLALVRNDETTRSELSGDAHELRLESGDDAVTLTTVHKSKGLEYPVVVLPFSWDAAKLHKNERELVRFHDPEQKHALTVDLGTSEKKQHEELAARETLAESLRLLYVALTRAQHRVTLVVPNVGSFAGSALAYTLFGGADAKVIEEKLQALFKSGELGTTLHAESERAGRCFSVRKLEATGTRYASRAPAELSARSIRRTLDGSYRVASFSSLVARERTAFGEAGLDRDAVEPDAESEERDLPSPLALGAFPRGAVAGQLVHEILEHAAFDGPREALHEVAARFVRARGYPSELAAQLVLGLERALRTPLDARGFCLAELPRAARIDELEFVFPVDGTLTPQLLDRVFRAHAAPRALPAYASDLRELSFTALHGYMRGFVDLVFRHEGRFYVVDYKSNWLGPRARDYVTSRLARAMAHHHYFLQYHLYVVALHRYLRQRVRDYDYERHFGGVYYLFLRGMAPEHEAQTGVFFDRPASALIDALDLALRGTKTEAS